MYSEISILFLCIIYFVKVIITQYLSMIVIEGTTIMNIIVLEK